MKNCKFGLCFVLLNTAILGAVASLSHFAYPLSGNSTVVGLFNPVNESVWEHLKFMFFPNLVWWITVFYIQKKKCCLNLDKWVIAAAVSLITAPMAVIFLYYSYTGAFGIESIVVDAMLVFVSYFIALKLAFHVYEHVKPTTAKVAVSIFAVALIFLAFIVFTFCPPHIPLFLDPITGTYGIG